MKANARTVLLIFFLFLSNIFSLQMDKTVNKNKSHARNFIPYAKVLDYVRTSLMNQEDAAKVEDKVQEILKMQENDILNFFLEADFKHDVKKYWYYYYLLAKVSMWESKHYNKKGAHWTKPKFREINDKFYKKMSEKDDEYQALTDNCKNSVLDSIIKYRTADNINWDEEYHDTKKERNIELYDFNYDNYLLRALKGNEFYRKLETTLPKGVIHHFHWSAAFDGNSIYEILRQSVSQDKEDDPERLVFVFVPVWSEDKSMPGKNSGKITYIIKLTKLKYLLPDNRAKYADLYAANIKSFRNNLLEETTAGDQCLSFDINEEDTSNPFEGLDTYQSGYLYAKLCDSRIYDDYLYSLAAPRTQLFKDLRVALERTTNINKTKYESMQELPAAYAKENSETLQTLYGLGIWVKFEEIFVELGDVFSYDTFIDGLNERVMDELANQKVIGLEMRNKRKTSDLNKYRAAAQHAGVKMSYIIPGRKVSGSGSKGGEVIDQDKNGDADYAGYDFFAYEDDPYNGARNFFTIAFTQVLKGQKESYFDKMFRNLDSEGGKFYPHAGETSFFPDHPINQKFAEEHYVNDNVIHAALLPGVKRLGHGFAIANNNLIARIIKIKGISLEICPISNELLKYYNVHQNPFLDLLRSGLHVSISPDDPGFFGYMGVAMDWFYIIMETDIKPSELYLLLKYSIEHSSIKEIHDHQDQYKEKVFNELVEFYKGLDAHTCRPNVSDIKLENHALRRKLSHLNSEIENFFFNRSVKGDDDDFAGAEFLPATK
jgi:adenosine deaminase